jgi:hypothetical protein
VASSVQPPAHPHHTHTALPLHHVLKKPVYMALFKVSISLGGEGGSGVGGKGGGGAGGRNDLSLVCTYE